MRYYEFTLALFQGDICHVFEKLMIKASGYFKKLYNRQDNRHPLACDLVRKTRKSFKTKTGGCKSPVFESFNFVIYGRAQSETH
jgi:hypothetical protein